MGTEGLQDRYINPYTDFGFKLLFGTAMNKEVLINFLNALLLGKGSNQGCHLSEYRTFGHTRIRRESRVRM